MKNIKVLGNLSDVEKEMDSGKTKMIYNDESSRFLFVNLKEGEKLAKHTSPHDLTIFTISGTGKFTAGAELNENINLDAGMLFQVEKNVLHEVYAESDLKLLLIQTK